MTQLAEQPLLRPTPSGWLAVTVTGYPRIGVQAATEDAARAQFERSRASWLELLDSEPGDGDA